MGVLREVARIFNGRERRVHTTSPFTPPRFGKHIVFAAPDKVASLVPVEQGSIMQALRGSIAVVVAV